MRLLKVAGCCRDKGGAAPPFIPSLEEERELVEKLMGLVGVGRPIVLLGWFGTYT